MEVSGQFDVTSALSSAKAL